MKTYNETRYACMFTETETDEQGNVVTSTKTKAIVEADANKKLEAAKEKQQPEPFNVTKMATFVYHEAESLAEISTLVPDETEAVNIFNRGYVLKQQGLVIDHTVDGEDTAGTAEPFDLQSEASTKSERRKMSPADKALKALSALGPDEIAKILAQFTAAQAA
jgi:uncharacterized protein with NAD-binding domain and iron-sulfur cluster